VDPTLAVAAEEALLSSAVGQLLENACKFSRPNGAIILSAGACGDRIEINVQDSCGGLAAGQAEKMLQLPVPGGTQNAAGGLSLCQHNVQANNGSLSVRDVPGSGCIFTISLPRRSFPKPV
jgi:signal transduction histidine kinase